MIHVSICLWCHNIQRNIRIDSFYEREEWKKVRSVVIFCFAICNSFIWRGKNRGYYLSQPHWKFWNKSWESKVQMLICKHFCINNLFLNVKYNSIQFVIKLIKKLMLSVFWNFVLSCDFIFWYLSYSDFSFIWDPIFSNLIRRSSIGKNSEKKHWNVTFQTW